MKMEKVTSNLGQQFLWLWLMEFNNRQHWSCYYVAIAAVRTNAYWITAPETKEPETLQRLYPFYDTNPDKIAENSCQDVSNQHSAWLIYLKSMHTYYIFQHV